MSRHCRHRMRHPRRDRIRHRRWPRGRSYRLIHSGSRGFQHCHRRRHRLSLPGSFHCTHPVHRVDRRNRLHRHKCHHCPHPLCNLHCKRPGRLPFPRNRLHRHKCHHCPHPLCNLHHRRPMRPVGCRCNRSLQQECRVRYRRRIHPLCPHSRLHHHKCRHCRHRQRSRHHRCPMRPVDCHCSRSLQ